jgi:hypothetical protein
MFSRQIVESRIKEYRKQQLVIHIEQFVLAGLIVINIILWAKV